MTTIVSQKVWKEESEAVSKTFYSAAEVLLAGKNEHVRDVVHVAFWDSTIAAPNPEVANNICGEDVLTC